MAIRAPGGANNRCFFKVLDKSVPGKLDASAIFPICHFW